MTRRAAPTSKPQWGPRSRGIIAGYRSGLEESTARDLERHGIDPSIYESVKIEYEVPSRKAKYTPDWPLPNGIIVETKGRFVAEDRAKHLLIKQQRPDLDIRFVFNSPNARLYKGSPTTYAMWCVKHGFKYSAKTIPLEWIKEQKQ